LHIFVRPEIRSLEDLRSKKVNFNTQCTAAAYAGPLIFSRLGLNVEKMFIPHQVALEQMKRGEVSAVVFVTSKPVDAFLKGRWDPGFKFLDVEYDTKFEDYYLPSSIDATDYPSLVPKGERIATIAVPTILVAYNWPQQSDRYRRVARLVDHLFSRLERLQSPGFDPKWKEVTCAPRCRVSSASGQRRNGLIIRRSEQQGRNSEECGRSHCDGALKPEPSRVCSNR
jgi:TRAP-type uncharacterized transport system substrate-binding protein